MLKNRTIKYFLFLMIAFVTALSLTQLFSRYSKTLAIQNRWTSQKLNIANSLVGTSEFLKSRNSIYGNAVQLGEWQGGHEIESLKTFNALEITAEIKLTPNSYLALEFNSTPNRVDGILFSLNKDFQSQFFLGDRDGKFLDSEIIKNANISENKWTSIRLLFNDKELSVIVEGTEVLKRAYSLPEGKAIALRGSLHNSEVKNIVVLEKNNEKWREYFSGPVNENPIAVVATIILFLLFSLLDKSSQNWKPFYRKSFFSVALYIMVATFLVDSADRYIVSRKFPMLFNFLDDTKPNPDSDAKIATERDIFYNLNNTFFSSYNEDNMNILFLGGTQTWSSGGLSDGDTLPLKFEKAIKAQWADSKVVVANGAVHGHRAEDQLELLKYFNSKRPRAVFFNMINSESSEPGALKKNVLKILEFCKVRQIKLILISEAVSHDKRTASQKENQDLLKAIAAENSLLFVDLDGYVDGVNNEGFKWWDEIHMTSFLMEKSAEYLAKSTIDELKKL